jgi:peptide-methionine (R)-S-oxide reductase
MKNYSKSPEAVPKLTPEQYRVTQENGIERPFRNEYSDRKEPRLYVEMAPGEPPFASAATFDSGTGWPGFANSKLLALRQQDWAAEHHRGADYRAWPDA